MYCSLLTIKCVILSICDYVVVGNIYNWGGGKTYESYKFVCNVYGIDGSDPQIGCVLRPRGVLKRPINHYLFETSWYVISWVI